MHEDNYIQLFESHFKAKIQDIIPIPQAGSDRKYYQLKSENISCVGTYGNDSKETKLL